MQILNVIIFQVILFIEFGNLSLSAKKVSVHPHSSIQNSYQSLPKHHYQSKLIPSSQSIDSQTSMESYQQLLKQFVSQETATIEQDANLQYIKLLNQLKTSKQKKHKKRNTILFESSRLKSFNQDLKKQSSLEKSRKTSRVNTINDNFQEKLSLVQLQSQSLQQQIDEISSAYSKLKHQKTLLKQQIQLIDKKEVEISTALNESINNVQMIKRLIHEQQISNERQFKQYDNKIEQMTLKLENINEQNVLNSKCFKEISLMKTESNTNSLLGGILMWQNQKNKIKRIPKKIFTKNQIESMLRALFLIIKLSNLNYGNIIQHLIKIADPDNEINQDRKSQKKIYLNQNGDEIEVKQLITILQRQLLTVNQSKFLSKHKIIEFYTKKGIVISCNKQNSHPSAQTLQLIQTVFHHFQKLTSWFSRIEKRNIQLGQYYQSLQKVDEQLSSQILSIQNSAAEKSINYLHSREVEIQQLQQRLDESCKVIFQFNINMHDLIRRFQNLNKFFDKVVKSTNRKTCKRTYVEVEDDNNFLKKITKCLFKSPQCIIMDWNNVINIHKVSSLIRTSESFENLPDNQIYFETIMKNDLLRIYAEPKMYQNTKSCIDNLNSTFDYVIGEATQIIEKLSYILKNLLLFSKNGIKEFEEYKTTPPPERKRVNFVNQNEPNDKLNPLLKILQQSNCDFNVQRFLNIDQIKQNDKPSEQQQNYCVQSNDYYRRDNFKLIQKLQKINLKKKGLLPTVPFLVNTSLQLEPISTTLDKISCDKETSRLGSTRNSYRSREPRLSDQLLSTRHNLLSEQREKESSRRKDLKMLLNSISNIASQNQKYRIKKKINLQQLYLSSSTSRIKTVTTKTS